MATYQSIAGLIPTPQLTPQLQNQIHSFVNQNPNASQQQISGFLAGQGVLPQSQGQTSGPQQSSGSGASTTAAQLTSPGGWQPGAITKFNQQASALAGRRVPAGTSQSFPIWGPQINTGQINRAIENNEDYAEMNKKYADTFDSRANAIKDLNEYNRYINDYWGGQAKDSPFLSKQAYWRSGDSRTMITPTGGGFEKVNYDRLPEVYDPSRNQRYENPAPMYAHGQITRSKQQPYPSNNIGPPTQQINFQIPQPSANGVVWNSNSTSTANSGGTTHGLMAANAMSSRYGTPFYNTNTNWKTYDGNTSLVGQGTPSVSRFSGTRDDAFKTHTKYILTQMMDPNLTNAQKQQIKTKLNLTDNEYNAIRKHLTDPAQMTLSKNLVWSYNSNGNITGFNGLKQVTDANGNITYVPYNTTLNPNAADYRTKLRDIAQGILNGTYSANLNTGALANIHSGATKIAMNFYKVNGYNSSAHDKWFIANSTNTGRSNYDIMNRMADSDSHKLLIDMLYRSGMGSR